YLVRSEGWQDVLRGSVVALALAQQHVRAAEGDDAVERLREQLEQLRQARRDDVERIRADLALAREERDAARRRVKELTSAARTAEATARLAAERLSHMRQNRDHELGSVQGENRRLRQRLTEAEDAVESVRRAGRTARGVADARLWLLVETLNGAATGLRRELALAAPDRRPADLVVTPTENDVAPAPSMRGADPALLDRLLALPMVHLLVDGYNVTMTGYGELPLQDQRTRLLGGLGILAAQTGAEVTCVFDGAERPTLLPQVPRGVRVLFSEPGRTADELIRRLVGVEPPGRAVVVVSTDREVADGIRAHGAHPVPSVVLVRRLDRR
nr:NYN domain-containing protein [Geodermatophilaceae bacterium]